MKKDDDLIDEALVNFLLLGAAFAPLFLFIGTIIKELIE